MGGLTEERKLPFILKMGFRISVDSPVADFSIVLGSPLQPEFVIRSVTQRLSVEKARQRQNIP